MKGKVTQLKLEVNSKLLANPLDDDFHVTLIYGLFPTSAVNWYKEIDELLANIKWRDLQMYSNQYKSFRIDNDKSAVVCLVNNTEIKLANKKLRTNLPHIDDFDFNPHITLCYVHNGCEEQVTHNLAQLNVNNKVVFQPTHFKIHEPSW